MTIRPGETLDGLLRNKIHVIQAQRGYRVSEDAVLLTWFTCPQAGELILDAGAGSGAIAFGLAVHEPTVSVVGLEIQEALADRAMRGVRLNGLEGRVCVVRGDVRDADRFFRPGIFDAIISNPPYHEPGRGKISLEREKALSRHQTMMPLEDLFRVSTSLLKPSGRLSLIYPASQVNRIMKVIEDTGFTLSRVLWIHSHESAQPVLLCVEAGVQCAPQQERTGRLYLYQARGIRTRIAEAILAGDSVDCTF